MPRTYNKAYVSIMQSAAYKVTRDVYRYDDRFETRTVAEQQVVRQRWNSCNDLLFPRSWWKSRMNGARAQVVVKFDAVQCGQQQKRPFVKEHYMLQNRVDMCGR